MIKYNWQRLNNYFKWSPPEVLKYFYYVSGLTTPAHVGRIQKKDREKIIQLYKASDNYSFIVNPIPLLLKHSNVTDMYNYIQIASLRNLFDYKVRNVDWVYTWQLPKGVNLSSNLLIVTKDKVYLKYDSKLTGENNG